jgi:uncharacterized membrane protein
MKKVILSAALYGLIAGLSLQAQSTIASSLHVQPSVVSDSTSFSLRLASSSLTLAQGQGGTDAITVSARCTNTVTFSASGFPAGVSYTFLPASSKTGTTLVVYASSSAAAGTYSVTVSGTSGWTVNSAGLTFTVTSTTPNFSVTAPAASLTLPRGTGTTVPITVNPGPSFTGVVAFGLTGIPAGVSYVFLPASSTTGSTLVIYASTSAVSGTYNVALTGTSGGLTASSPGQLILQ